MDSHEITRNSCPKPGIGSHFAMYLDTWARLKFTSQLKEIQADTNVGKQGGSFYKRSAYTITAEVTDVVGVT